MTWNRWFSIGAILAGLSVALGAFAAHGLNDVFAIQYAGKTRLVAGEEVPLAAKYLADFKTAAAYQMYHALAIMVVSAAYQRGVPRSVSLANWSFLLGILLFSGSLYALTLTGISKLGAITPIGGVLFLAGWILTSISAWNFWAGQETDPKVKNL